MKRNLRNLRKPERDQSIESYLQYVNKRLQQLDLQALADLCREWGVGIDELALWIVADQYDRPVESIAQVGEWLERQRTY